MTTPQVAEHGAPARAREADSRFRFARSLVVVEIAVTAAEIVLVVGPALALAAQSLAQAARSPTIAAAVAGLMVLGWLRAADLMRPVIAARNAKRAGRALGDQEIAATERAIRRAPLEIALSRWLLWTAAGAYVAFYLVSRGLLPWPSAVGLACITALHAGGAAATRGALWERRLERARRLVLPNFDACAASPPAIGAGCARPRGRCWRSRTP